MKQNNNFYFVEQEIAKSNFIF